MGGVFIVFLSLLQVYLCWQAYRVLCTYIPYLCLFTYTYRTYVVLLLCSGDDLHSLEGSGSGGDQNRNAIGRTTSRPGARRVLQTFYVPLECFNCVQRPASSVSVSFNSRVRRSLAEVFNSRGYSIPPRFFLLSLP